MKDGYLFTENIYEKLLEEICQLTGGTAAIWYPDGTLAACSDFEMLRARKLESVKPVENNNFLCMKSMHQVIGYVYYHSDEKNEKLDAMVIKLVDACYQSQYYRELLQRRDQARQLFIYDWLFSEKDPDNEAFCLRGKMLGIDINLNYTLLLLRITGIYAISENERQKQLLYQIIFSEL